MTIILVAGFLCDSANATVREPDASWRFGSGVTVHGVLLHGRQADLIWINGVGLWFSERCTATGGRKATNIGRPEILDQAEVQFICTFQCTARVLSTLKPLLSSYQRILDFYILGEIGDT